MDLFGKKRIAELEATITQLQSTLSAMSLQRDAAKNQVEYLVRTIRNMDEQIYKMSQCTSWSVMRPNFLNLEEGMIARKRAESDRIGELIRPELIKTYGPKQIGNK
jgi:uncharacterized coiled-coil protein SlyX